MALRAWARLRIPLIAHVRPSVVALDQQRVVIRVPLRRRNRNHLGSMYFGALAVGADLAGGYLALQRIREAGRPVSFVFKDVHAEFLRRPDGDVHFACEAGPQVRELVDRTVLTGEREELPVAVTATVPARTGDEAVARFVLTLSVKAR